MPIPGGVTGRDGVKDLDPASESPRRWRVKLSRAIDKEIEFKIQTRSLLGGDAARFAIELPKLAGVLDRILKRKLWA